MNLTIRTFGILMTLTAVLAGQAYADPAREPAAPSTVGADCDSAYPATILRARGLGHRVPACRQDAADSVDSQLASSDADAAGDLSCDRVYRNAVLRARGLSNEECAS